MPRKAISAGPVHTLPADLRKALSSDPAALAKWEDITPLARNEWICWVTYVKKPETRRDHVDQVRSRLKEGQRRPCCWPGCPHREKTGAPLIKSGQKHHDSLRSQRAANTNENNGLRAQWRTKG